MSFRFSLSGLACLLTASAAVLTVCTYYLLNFSVDRFVMRDAESQAYTWGSYLAENLPYLEEIAAGTEPTNESKAFIRKASSIGNVFRFKLFDKDGVIRLISDELGKGDASDGSLKLHNPKAAGVIETRQPYTEVKKGTPPKRPLLYAETYIPVVKNGRIAAIVEVYVDQTAAQELARSQFTWVGLALMVITLFSFVLPGTAFYFRSRQKLRADERVHFLAHHDAMTGLMNRTSFSDALAKRLSGKRSGDAPAAVYYIDIDRFKEVNDTLGHDVGDALIFEIGERLRSVTREDDLVARLGGDEFAVAQFGMDRVRDAEGFATRVINTLSQPIVTDNHDVSSTSSIGIALAPKDGTTSTQLFKCADVALYQAKADGRNRYLLFTPEMNEVLERRRNVETILRKATEANGCELHFQPLFDIEGTSLTGFEALLRLNDEKVGQIPPDEFIPIAEEMGLIVQIGDWVLTQACSVAAEWPDHLKIAVNLSPQQFRDNGIVESVSRALASSGLKPTRLELEITESLLMHDTVPIMQQLKDLKARGVSIVMDDFGTGYSSLSYLWRFPFDKLKIDRSFMEAASHTDPSIRNILQTIVSLGHSLNMEVTAEGIETFDQANLLKALFCDHLQGFLFGRPMPKAELAGFILKNFKAETVDRPGEEDTSINAPESQMALGHTNLV